MTRDCFFLRFFEVRILHSVEHYFKAVQRMTNLLPKDVAWSLDVTQHFVTHLRQDIRAQMQSAGHIYNSTVTPRDGYSQLMALQASYASACIAETAIHRVRKIAQDEVSQHSFVTQINKSVAEDTLQQYSKANCWGCLEDGHSFAGKGGRVTCPNASKPGVTERAAKASAEFNEKIKKR
jgi:rubrerythrin